MNAKPTAKSPNILTEDVWKAMTKRRKEEKANQKLPWLPILQDKYQYKEMVEALLGGRITWKNWQTKHPFPSISLYDFEYLDFFHEINIEWTEFAEGAVFTNTTFAKQACFNHATFTKEAYFSGAKFTEKTNFLGATFNKGAYFSGAAFAKDANFWLARFKEAGFFTGAKFSGDEINFSQMILSPDSSLIFVWARFENAVPDFRFINRIPDMRFHNFSVPSPDELMKKNKWQYHNEDYYRKLKELAIGNDNHEYELKLYGYEMDSKLINIYGAKEKRFFIKKWCRSFNKKLWKFCNKKIWRLCNEKIWKFYKAIKKIVYNIKRRVDVLPTHLYQCFSNYGQSILRPFAVLFVLAIIYSLDWNAIFQSIPPLLSFINPLLSFINNIDWVAIVKTILPLPLFVTNFGDYEPISNFGLTIKIIASIFWFFLFLGLRNKFKIK